jgi:tRNA pseudouridine38-40 synthase
MQRYKIKIEYNGSDFHGWQEQNGLKSVQSTIQNAIFQFCNEKVFVYGAGRTDAGVHALEQVAHFDLQKKTDAKSVQNALNHFLKNENVCILVAEQVNNSFHARFSAKSRSYFYSIINRKSHLTINQDFAWHVPEHLNIDLMNEAAQYLIGYHDFESFRSTQCQAKSSFKSIDYIKVERLNEQIKIHITAKSFLHNQVRIIVGTLRRIGNGFWSPSKMNEILQARNRSAAGQTAPAKGLFLCEVTY